MLDRETEEHWETIKESYPDAVLFHEYRELFIVKGRDREVLAKEFGIRSDSRWYGFDEEQARAYMSELVQRGYAVVQATTDGVRCIVPPADRRQQIQRQRAKSRFLAITPTLLFDEREIEGTTSDRWLKQRSYEDLFERFKRWLRTEDRRSLRAYGEVYVYQVGDWYEVDPELTSMLETHVLLLAKAALATGRQLPCRVVEPKCRRERNGHRPSRPIPTENVPRLGQLSFDGFAQEC